MKAVLFKEYGSPDNLSLEEVPVPVPKENEVLVRVQASSINSWDWEFLNGQPFINRLMFGLLRPRHNKRILGADIAGTVEAVGSRVSRFQPGDEVFGDLWSNWGGFAEFACAAETALELKPSNLSFVQAAAVPQAGVLALQGLRKSESLQGKRVLINGAGGGVGSFAIQIAKLGGAEVTGVDAADKLDLVRALGATQVIDYAKQDFANTKEQYDLVLDCQNLRSIADNRRALKEDGIYAMIGGTRILPVLFQHYWGSLSGERQKFCLVAEGPNKGLAELGSLLETEKLVPALDAVYPLSKVPEALCYFGTGRHKGKVGIVVDGLNNPFTEQRQER